MTEKFKILAQYIKDLSSETPNVETYLFVKDNISKYNLNIDITSNALKDKLIEVNTSLKFSDIEANEKKSYFEIIYATIIKVNDEITWKSVDKGHNVEFIGMPVGVSKYKSKISKDAKFKFTKPGIYLYQCTPHKAMGMIGLVIVGNDKSNLDKIKKVKVYGKSKKLLKGLLKSIG